MSEELPRPATPGPWSTQGAVRYDRCWFVWAADASIARMAHAELGKAQEQDAAAIAALPEWIEDRDRWKARAEKAEKALAEIEDWGVASFDDDLLKFIQAVRERHGSEAAE